MFRSLLWASATASATRLPNAFFCEGRAPNQNLSWVRNHYVKSPGVFGVILQFPPWTAVVFTVYSWSSEKCWVISMHVHSWFLLCLWEGGGVTHACTCVQGFWNRTLAHGTACIHPNEGKMTRSVYMCVYVCVLVRVCASINWNKMAMSCVPFMHEKGIKFWILHWTTNVSPSNPNRSSTPIQSPLIISTYWDESVTWYLVRCRIWIIIESVTYSSEGGMWRCIIWLQVSFLVGAAFKDAYGIPSK